MKVIDGKKYTGSLLTFSGFIRQGPRGDPGLSGQEGYLGATVSLVLTISRA